MRRNAVFTRMLRAFPRYATVVVTALTLVSTGPLEVLVASATVPDAPEPLSVSHVRVAEEPLSFYLPFQSGPQWASDSEAFWTSTEGAPIVQPPPILINGGSYVPYRFHEFADAVAVELPAADGRQILVLNRGDLSSAVFAGGESGPLRRVAVQELAFEAYREPDAASGSPLLTVDPGDAGWWYRADVDDTELSVDLMADRVAVTRSFTVTHDDREFSGTVTAIFGFDGTSAVNKWTYRIDAAPDAPVFRLLATTDMDGEMESEHIGGRNRYRVKAPEAAPVLELEPSTVPTPAEEVPVPTDTPIVESEPTGQPEESAEAVPSDAGSVPVDELFVPVQDVPLDAGPTSLLERIRSLLVPVVLAEEITPQPPVESVEPTPTPTETQTPEPTPEPVPTATATPEPSAEPSVVPSSEPAPSESAVVQPSAEPSPEPSPSALPVVIPEPPSPVLQAWEWLQGLFGETGGQTSTLVIDSRDHRGPVSLTEEGNRIVVTYETAVDTPDDAAFFVDPSFGVESSDTGITITSGDGTGSADFRLHFNPGDGGVIDELFAGTDFTTNRVAVPTSSSGALAFTNIGSYAQAEQTARLTILESSPVRVVVESELDLIATGSAPASLIERYAVYPSGRIIQATQVSVEEPTTVTASFNASASAMDAGYTDTEKAGQLYLSDTGPDLLMFWHDPTTVASASVDTALIGDSRVTTYGIPIPEGQSTWYRLIELTQPDLNLLIPASFRRHPDDYRNPDEPVMTRGSFLGYQPSLAAYRFEAVNNVVVFRLDGNTVPRINPTFEITNWSDPDLTAFKAQLNGRNMQEGIDYVIGFQDDEPRTGTLLFQYLHTVEAGDQFNAEGQPLPPLFDIDPNDAAAIKRVQRGTAQISGSSLSVVINLPFPVIASRAFVVGGDAWGGGTSGPQDDGDANRLSYWLTPTQLIIERGRADQIASTTWQVVEFEDNAGAFVQRGSVSMDSASLTATSGTFPVAVNTNKAFPLVTRNITDTAGGEDPRWTLTASLSATALSFERTESGDTAGITWQVVQLDGISVQRGQTTLSTSSRQTNVTIGAVDTAKSFVVSTARELTLENGAEGGYQYDARLTSSTNLRFTRDDATAYANVVHWHVVTFGAANGGPRTQAGVKTFTASETKLTVTPLPRAVAATRSFAFSYSYGGATDPGATDLLEDITIYPRLADDGKRLHLGREVGALAASASWQIIEFTRPSIQQDRYRWRNDVGAESLDANWAASQNASTSMTAGTIYRLRFGLNNADTGSATNQYRLEFARKAAGGTCATGLSAGWQYQAVPVTATLASHAFDMEDSAHLTNAAGSTDNAGLTNPAGKAFVAGETDDTTNQTTSIGLASVSFTEIEYALRANSNAAHYGKYCFRLSDAGEARASQSFIFYPTYAEAEVVFAPPTFTQNSMRWYANADATGVSDPWTPTFSTVASSSIYTSAGSHTFRVPSGVTSITAKVWGAGGGGGEGNAADPGGNGGGGGYAAGTITVTPGETLSIDVGTGGIANTGGTQMAGYGGGFSAVRRSSTYLVQAGGGGGGGSADGATNEAGGNGGPGGGTTGSNGTTGGGGVNDFGDGGSQVAGGTGGSASAGLDGATGAANAGGNGGASGTGGAGGTGGGGSGAVNGGGGGGGGGGGRYGGGGGESGSNGVGVGGGGGGGGGSSGFDAGVTSTTTVAGSGTSAGNNADAYYAGGAGAGGTGSSVEDGAAAGTQGRVVILYGTLTGGGSADIEENEAVIQAQWAAPERGDQIRLRMSLLVGSGTMFANSAAFKLQFAEAPAGVGGCSIVASWTDVGASTSSGVWRFGGNMSVTDGTTLGSTVLTSSDVAGTYEEGNNTALNPSQVAVGQDIEYDFSLQNNTGAGGSLYCFRMVKSDGTALDSYARYPSIVTPPTPNNMEYLLRHGEFFSPQGAEQPYYWSEIW